MPGLSTTLLDELTPARDSSLEFFKELVTYRGQLVSNGSGKPALDDEVALVSSCRKNSKLSVICVGTPRE